MTSEPNHVGHDGSNAALRFAEACFAQNTRGELAAARDGAPDPQDMKEWGLTPDQWLEAIQTAICWIDSDWRDTEER